MVIDRMKSLIFDMNVLIYIHDIMFLKENSSEFKYSNTYKELHECNLLTVIKYLKDTLYTLASFIIILIILKNTVFSNLIISYGTILMISIAYGILFVRSFEDILVLKYQLKAKKAVQYALANFSYKEFVLFLDSYLSEVSTKNYLKII